MSETQMVPLNCTVAGCACEKHQWNGRAKWLATDPPSTCVCGHETFLHRYVQIKRYATGI